MGIARWKSLMKRMKRDGSWEGVFLEFLLCHVVVLTYIYFFVETVPPHGRSSVYLGKIYFIFHLYLKLGR